MSERKIHDATRRYERYVADAGRQTYVLRLYVVGATPASTRAIANLKTICEQHLQGRYELEVVDIFQQPTLAKGEQIIAAPTLVKVLPPPLRKFIGDLTGVEGKLLGVDLIPRERPE